MSRLLLRVGALGCVAALGSVALAARPSEPRENPACIKISPEVRYRNMGYDHIVHLDSACSVEASCSVATNVSPTPVEVKVRPHERVEVLTFRGSPAREFTPLVTCQLSR